MAGVSGCIIDDDSALRDIGDDASRMLRDEPGSSDTLVGDVVAETEQRTNSARGQKVARAPRKTPLLARRKRQSVSLVELPPFRTYRASDITPRGALKDCPHYFDMSSAADKHVTAS